MRRLVIFIYELLGQHREGEFTKPPLDHRMIKLKDDSIVFFCSDGGEVWIGTPNEWKYFYKHNQFRKIIFWYLRQWIFVDWFGLRSFIWYKCLSYKVSPQ